MTVSRALLSASLIIGLSCAHAGCSDDPTPPAAEADASVHDAGELHADSGSTAEPDGGDAGIEDAEVEADAEVFADATVFPDAQVVADGAITVEPLPDPLAIAGALTIENYGNAPFLTPASLEEVIVGPFSIGREFFVADWLVAPNAQRPNIDGLGPLFHAASCLACHPQSGRPEAFLANGTVGVGVLFRLAQANGDGDPLYGAQLQPLAISGVPAEGSVRVVATASSAAFQLDLNPEYGPLSAGTVASPRLSPQLVGLGLLEAADPAVILEREDPADLDGDGISGRAAWLDPPNNSVLGRFGWKAVQPTIRDQSAAAFISDLGITSVVRVTDDCTSGQVACVAAMEGGAPEISGHGLDGTAFFMRFLGVPAARRNNADPQMVRGNELFFELGCEKCHRASLLTGGTAGDGPLSAVRFHAYTDLLLHDLGPDLTDRIGEGVATAEEWRTPPLWGLGLVAQNPAARFLHDGRAATIEDAVRAHGGEAAGSSASFEALGPADAAAFSAFLRSL